MRETFAEDIFALLSRHGTPPSSMELEITESLLLNIVGQVNNSLQILLQMGVLIAIDDLGLVTQA